MRCAAVSTRLTHVSGAVHHGDVGIDELRTAPWYHPSEIVLGRVFERLKDEYPRESYQIITKLGKYGPKAQHHTYDADSVRASVYRSLKRLKTDYLDIVRKSCSSPVHPARRSRPDLHDVEFVSSHPFPCPGGDHLSALSALSHPGAPDPFRLRAPHEPHGAGDEQIMEGLRALAALRTEGKVRKIGIAGYPLPVLLRLSLLASAHGVTLDIVQTYAQQTILNPSLAGGYLAAFAQAGVKEVTNAAPLAMGILTSSGGPEWHPARSEADGMYDACVQAAALCRERGTTLEEVALNYGYKEIRLGQKGGGDVVPVVIGCKNIEEIKRTIKQWREVNVPGVRNAETTSKVEQVESEVIRLFEEKGVKGVSWSSPGQHAL